MLLLFQIMSQAGSSSNEGPWRGGSTNRERGDGEEGRRANRDGEETSRRRQDSEHADTPRVEHSSTKSVRRQQSDSNAPPRLLIVSSKIRNSSVMSAAVLSNIVFLQYKYESTTLDSLLTAIAQQLGTRKVDSVAFICNGNTNNINITGKDEKVFIHSLGYFNM